MCAAASTDWQSSIRTLGRINRWWRPPAAIFWSSMVKSTITTVSRAHLAERHHVPFVTRSDTEVLLKGLMLEGVEFIKKLDGIFAFAFVDLLSKEVMLARDVFGVKPLYYYSEDDRLYVSSEVRPLWRVSRGAIRMPNMARYLSYGVVGNGETVVSGVSELAPNSIKLIRSGKVVRTSTIHEFAFDTRGDVSIEELGEVLYRTIDSQRPQIPFGVMFSGGLDSTLILDRCADDQQMLGAYSVDVRHPVMSERQWQEYVVDKLNLVAKYRKIELCKDHFSVENLAKISGGLDYPLFHPNFVGSLLLTRMASEEGLKVLISGEGADELFLGYRWFFSESSTFRVSRIRSLAGCTKCIAGWDGPPNGDIRDEPVGNIPKDISPTMASATGLDRNGKFG